MPTVIREGGLEIRIYTLDHPPPHVHVAKAGAVVKIALANSEVLEIVGRISDREIRRAENLVAKHSVFLSQELTRIHGKPTDRNRS